MIKRREEEITQNWKGDIDKPVVSVCCITYNHEKYIEEAIDSFLMQETDFPFEIVIGEDCSTDSTRKIIDDYIKEYPKLIKLVTSESNVGVNINIIRTYKECKGDYISVCEGDDYWIDSKKLQLQKEFLQNNLEYSICYHDSIFISVCDKNGTSKLNDFSKQDFTSKQLMKSKGLIATQTVMFRNCIEVYPEELYNVKNFDSFFFSILGIYGKGHYIKNIKPARYRIHQNGIWSLIDIDSKNIETVKSLYWMSVYYESIGYSEVAMYHKLRAIKNLVGKKFFNFKNVVTFMKVMFSK